MTESESKPWGLFRFTAEHGAQTVTVEIPGDSNLSDTLDAVETFLIAAGFNAEQVRKGLPE